MNSWQWVGYAPRLVASRIAAEVIEPAGYGYVDFTLPFLREYLRDHAGSLV